MILQYLTRFQETNKISRNFSGITIDFREIAKSFFDFRFRFCYLQKMTVKFRCLSELIQNFKVLHFLMAKVIKVNIAVTY
jgi:hypothetical protein